MRFTGEQEQTRSYPHNIEARSPPPEMMMADSKYFPGHPQNFSPTPGFPRDPSPLFPRKDFFSQRKQREFIPEAKKDDCYWDRRRRNNEAAKRSREKRRLNDMLLETRVIELSKDNHILQAQLNAIFEKYGIKGENMIEMDVVLSTLPSNDQVLNFTKKRLGPLEGCPESPPPSLTFQSLGLPITINNNNNTSNNNNRSCSPNRNLSPPDSYRDRSPSPLPFQSGPPMPALSSYTDMHTGQRYQENIYRRASPQRYEEDQRDEQKDSGHALNLSADRSDQARDESRSSASSTPPVTSSNIQDGGSMSSNIQDGGSSGDESGYPRSPNSAGSSGDHSLPHKLRFKSVVSEKEAVSSLLSLHQMAMIKREPAEHINHWMEAAAGAAGGLHHPAFLASLKHQFHVARDNREEVQDEVEEPPKKRFKPPMPDNLKDEVARLTSEVATLKDILVNSSNRCREITEDEEHE